MGVLPLRGSSVTGPEQQEMGGNGGRVPMVHPMGQKDVCADRAQDFLHRALLGLSRAHRLLLLSSF